jgi:hypothetical protein
MDKPLLRVNNEIKRMVCVGGASRNPLNDESPGAGRGNLFSFWRFV